MRVRWTTRCAGRCGTWLRAGSQAPRRHRRHWCPTCFRLHLTTCAQCRQSPVPREAEPAQQELMLW